MYEIGCTCCVSRWCLCVYGKGKVSERTGATTLRYGLILAIIHKF